MSNSTSKEQGYSVQHAAQTAHLSLRGRRELNSAGRSFVLRSGEELRLLSTDDDAFLFISQGSAEVRYPSGTMQSMKAQIKPVPLLLPRSREYVTVHALSDCELHHIEGDTLDHLSSWDEFARSLPAEQHLLRERAEKIHCSLSFKRLPVENVQQALSRMKPVKVVAGANVITQGEPGDAFYVIDMGRAEVWQTGLFDDEPQKVAELGEGDSFGEEALVGGGTRNATVRMTENGQLLRLEKDDYIQLLSDKTIREVDAQLAKSMLDKGYGLLDVRYEEEYEDEHIPESTLIPLHELRDRIEELDTSRQWVVYCRSGRRSQIACLLLHQRKYDVVSLNGGMRDWPYEVARAE